MIKRLLPGGWFFESRPISTRKEIFIWWEKRRLTFNFWVGMVGICTWLSVEIFGSLAVKPGVDFEEPIMMIIGPFVYAILANICYTGGPIFDEIFFTRSPSVKLLRLGFWFSIFVTALPGLWALYCWIHAIRTGVLLD